jgi:hypothetical protein
LKSQIKLVVCAPFSCNPSVHAISEHADGDGAVVVVGEMVVVMIVVEVEVVTVDVVGHVSHITRHASFTPSNKVQYATESPLHTGGSSLPPHVVGGHFDPIRRLLTGSCRDPPTHPHGGATSALATTILLSTDFSNFVALVPTRNKDIFPAVRPTALLYALANSVDIISRWAASNNT